LRPWQITPDRTRIQTLADRDDFEIADCYSGPGSPDEETAEANAAFIVRAVNSHDALVKERDELRKLAMVYREALEKAKNHSCEIEGAEFGIFSCCNQRDYVGHAESCYLVQSLSRIPGEEESRI